MLFHNFNQLSKRTVIDELCKGNSSVSLNQRIKDHRGSQANKCKRDWKIKGKLIIWARWNLMMRTLNAQIFVKKESKIKMHKI